MRDDTLAGFGTGGGVVEVDETFIGNDRSIKPMGVKKGRGYAHKHKILSLVDRSTGRAKSMVVDNIKAETLLPIRRENIARDATIYTYEASQYGASPPTSRAMTSCATALASRAVATCIPTRLRATSASSSAA